MQSYTERDIVIAIMSVYLKHCDVWLAAFRAGCLCCVLIIFFWFSGLYIIVRLIFGAKCFVEARRLISSCLLYLWICIQFVFRWFSSVWFWTWTVNLIGLWSTNCNWRRSGRLWAGRFSVDNTLSTSHRYWGLATALSTRLKIFYLCLSMHLMAPYWGYFCWWLCCVLLFKRCP